MKLYKFAEKIAGMMKRKYWLCTLIIILSGIQITDAAQEADAAMVMARYKRELGVDYKKSSPDDVLKSIMGVAGRIERDFKEMHAEHEDWRVNSVREHQASQEWEDEVERIRGAGQKMLNSMRRKEMLEDIEEEARYRKQKRDRDKGIEKSLEKEKQRSKNVLSQAQEEKNTTCAGVAYTATVAAAIIAWGPSFKKRESDKK